MTPGLTYGMFAGARCVVLQQVLKQVLAVALRFLQVQLLLLGFQHHSHCWGSSDWSSAEQA